MEASMFAPTYATGVPIMAGDWVRVLSSGVWHHGIVRRLIALWGGGLAVEIANNVKFVGVTVSDWHVFASGQEILLHRRAPSTEVPGILRRVEESMGKTYSLATQNCEHFASYAFTGKAESKQIQGVGIVVLGFVALWLLAG